MSQLVTFVGVALVVIVTPGQDAALTIRNTLDAGRRGGILTALGVVSGQLTWTAATSAGLAALLVASEPVFRALKLLGAAYLVFLGVQSLLAAVRGGGWDGRVRGDRPVGRGATAAAYRQGLISNLGNAKVGVFFTSLLPQFAPAGDQSFWQLFPLGVVFAALTLAWLTAYALAVAKAGDFLRRRHVRRLLEGVTGAVLVALGLRLAAAKR